MSVSGGPLPRQGCDTTGARAKKGVRRGELGSWSAALAPLQSRRLAKRTAVLGRRRPMTGLLTCERQASGDRSDVSYRLSGAPAPSHHGGVACGDGSHGSQRFLVTSTTVTPLT